GVGDAYEAISRTVRKPIGHELQPRLPAAGHSWACHVRGNDMNIRRVGLLNVVTFSLLIALIAGGLSLTSRVVAAADDAATEDVIYTVDGRELRGKILEESRGQIIFEYRDPNINITTKITLQMSQIAHIDRNV